MFVIRLKRESDHPGNFENAVCVLAHFKVQRHQFRLYGRTIFEGLLLADVHLFIIVRFQPANSGFRP